MKDAWLLHKRGIELCGDWESLVEIDISNIEQLTAADDSPIIPWEARVGRRGTRSAPDMIGGVG